MKKQIPLVVTYNFDTETPVYLFDSYEQAFAEMKRQYEEELRIEREENECSEEDLDYEISEQEGYAKIAVQTIFTEVMNVTEWHIGDLKN